MKQFITFLFLIFSISYGYTQEPAVAAPTPTQDAANVISMFSEAFTDVTVDTWRTDWSDGVLEDVMIAGNATKKYSNLNFAGIETVGANLIDASTMTHFRMDVWTPDANDFKIKLVDFGADAAFGGGDDTEHEITFAAPTTGSWISYDIPLTDFVGLTNTEHIAQYIMVKAPLGTVFVDNVYFYAEQPPTEPTVAAPAPTQDAANVISLFSDVYTDVTVDTWRTDWSDGVLEDVMIAGNATKKYSNLNFVGIETVGANLIDASTMTHFRMDVWTPDANDFKIKLVDFGADAAFGGGDDTEHEITFAAPTTGSWISYDIPLTDFVGLTNTEHIAQYIMVKAPLGTVFVDNVYFYAEQPPTEPTVAAPAPTQDAANVISLFSDVYTDVTVDTWRTDWSDGVLEDVMIAGNATKKYSNLNFVGIETVGANLIDASTMTHFRMDVWTPDANDFKIKLVDFGADAAFGGGDDTEHELTFAAPTTGSWISYDIPLTDFVGLTNTEHIAQYIMVKAPLGTVFVDNVYFYSEPASPASNYCQTEVTHLNIAAETASAILLTITNVDATSMYVEAESADADPVDFLLVNNGSGATISDAVEVSPGVFRRTLSWATAPENVDLEILWSKVSFAGNWMLSTFSVPFAANCDNAGGSNDATLNDLLVSGTTVSGFSPNTLSYAVELPNGTTVVPTVTATTNDVNATYVINDAAGLPGTTEVVVTAEDGTTSLTYIVNFTLAAAVPTVGAPTPVHDEVADNVFSIYSDSYTNLANTNFNPNWSQSTQVTVDQQVGGNNTLVYTNLNYQGTNLGSADGLPQDLTSKDYLHVDFWTPNATALNFVLISQTSGEQAYALPIQTEQWVSVNIPLSHYSGLGLDLSDIFQFKVDQGDGTTVVYFDNWYFWEVSASTDATLIDLQVDGTTIPGFDSGILSYDVELADGTTIVPTVTATTNSANATYVVNDAAGLPGTTSVVVTAEDGVTILTYNVNFVFADPAPAVAAPIPGQDPIDVISIYSGTYTDLAGTNFNPGWGQTTQVSFLDIVGNETMLYENFNYQGTQLSGPQDLSIMEFMHVDIWTADATVLKVTPISQSSGEFLIELTPLNQGSWNSYDIPVGDFTGVSMGDIHQLKFDGQDGVSPSNIYLDNIYFWKNPTASGSDATLNDLQVDGTTVSGFSPNTLSYTVELPNGTTVVPTVTATTNDVNATYVINDATGLPGTTEVVVTAQDGTTSLTYSVIFTLADAVPTVGAPIPTHDEVDDNVFSIYSDSYTNLANTNFNPAWGQSTQVIVDEQIGGNNTLVYTNFNYQGTNLGSADGSPQDFTGHDYFHLDFWTPDATAINFSLISQTSGEVAYALPVQTEQWVSVNIPLTHFTNAGLDISDIYQFKLDGGNSSVTIYLDNWYFWEVSAGTDASLSDLQVDGTTVTGFSSDILSYDVELPNGTTIVPTVTATTTSNNATYVVNDAAGLPGTTDVVVTAEDGVTTLTYFVNFVFPDPAPTVAAPTPTQEPVDVISIYSGTYTDLAGTNFNPGWGQTTQVSFVDIVGNETMLYENFNYQGTQLDGNQDLSLMEFMHVDIWTADATVIKVSPISAGTGEWLVSLTPLNQGSWNSYDIPVTDFDGVSMTDIHQLKFDGQDGVNPSNIYLDNIYFWKTPAASGSDATLNDLQVDGTTVAGFSPNILSYTIELPFGTTIVPTVTATTTDPNATYVINDAAALPGTTSVVVTADDDVTMLTYSVIFTLANPVPTDGAPTPVHDEVAHNVFSIYSDSYTNLENTNFNPAWGQSTQVAIDEQIGGNNTLVYTNFNYQGTNLGSADGSPQDLTAHDYFHLDFWTPDASTINFFLISQTSGEVPYALTVTTGEWVSVNIPLSHFTDAGLDISDIYQFKFDGGNGSVTIYLDNWYFWTVSENGDATLSDLQVDGTTVAGFASNVFNYEVELPEGTTIVPTVTATTTDPDAEYIVIDATGLPGTTEVVVTAEDGVTTLTYYVNFVFPGAFPQEAAPDPTENQEDVISMFSDVYTDVVVDTWLTDWSQADLEEVLVQGNPTKLYTNLNFAGIETVTEPIDLENTGMLYLHIDFWTPNITAFRIKLVDFGEDGFGGGNDTEFELTFTPTFLEWNSLDIPLEDFEGMNMSDINQFILSSDPSGSSTVFVDNVYFYKDPVGIADISASNINVYPNPASDYWMIESEIEIQNITVYNMNGELIQTLENQHSNLIRLDASILSPGVYFVRIQDANSVNNIKLIKE